MITLYGRRLSRAARCLWVLEELGLPYEHIAYEQFSEETRSNAYRQLNPAGKIPTLVDGDIVVTESIAITFYLAMKAPTALWPANASAAGAQFQWSSWAVTEAEPPLLTIVRQLKREGGPDAAAVAEARSTLTSTLALLESHLSKGAAYLTGSDFTIADINAATAVAPARTQIDFDSLPAISAWLERAFMRPSWTRVQGKA